MMNDIQKARDVLAKWRKGSRTQHWLTSIDDPALDTMPNGERALQFGSFDPGDARLIVGTAGNPDLLDAIDGLLAQEQRRRTSMHDNRSHDLSHHATRIAAAILAADERMGA